MHSFESTQVAAVAAAADADVFYDILASLPLISSFMVQPITSTLC